MSQEKKLSQLPHWYAVYTRPRWEKKVAELFSRKGVENYCPLNRVLRQWSDRKKWIFEPLIKSYVFVRIMEEQLVEIRTTPGVINFVYWLGKPAIVKEDEIIRIKKFLNEYEDVKVERTEVRINDTVRIVKGPLMSEEGKIIKISKHTVKLILPGLGYNLIAEVKRDNIELAGN
jgi:transcription antitermination factor NusG